MGETQSTSGTPTPAAARLAAHVRAWGRGPGRSRSLTCEEATDAMAVMLAGEAAPEAVGALLMLMRYRGETPEEIAGFVSALRTAMPDWPGTRPALDWPCYAAGRSRGLPWFLLAGRILAATGTPVILHGPARRGAAPAAVPVALPAAGIPMAADPAAASRHLAADGIAFLPLDAYAPAVQRLLDLRAVLGLRSAVNTALRMSNPAGAATSVQGVFHPPYRPLQQAAARLLGDPSTLVIKGGGGEFERHPAKAISLWGQRAGETWRGTAPVLLPEAAQRLADGPSADDPEALARLWAGKANDRFATAVVTGTLALALLALGRVRSPDAADRMAEGLWARRHDLVPA
jgi:anthranilate phosphoribosyltransferase